MLFRYYKTRGAIQVLFDDLLFRSIKIVNKCILIRDADISRYNKQYYFHLNTLITTYSTFLFPRCALHTVTIDSLFYT